MVEVFTIEHGVSRHPDYRLREPVNIVMEAGECWAITGPNGAGKSLLAQMIIGKSPLLYGNEVHYGFSPSALTCTERIKILSFVDRYGDADTGYFHQQRWHSQDAECSPVAAEWFGPGADDAIYRLLYQELQIEPLLQKRMVHLSGGEFRKLQLMKALAAHPALLLLDNPFIGLDAEAQRTILDGLDILVRLSGTPLILILPQGEEIPPFVTHVIAVEERVCAPKCKRTAYMKRELRPLPLSLSALQREVLLARLRKEERSRENAAEKVGEEVIGMQNIRIAYGGHTLLRLENWRVQRGERWAVTGANGSGKSTLLSLICADNPQSYACTLRLFGRRRGTGESIWDIKRKIGFVSSELHRACTKNLTALQVMLSAFTATGGYAGSPTPAMREACDFWLDIFGLSAARERSFLQLSFGEQRLLLLARTFVNFPRLLVLDEPFQGLDNGHIALAQEIIIAYTTWVEDNTLLMVSHAESDFPSCITHRLRLQGANR